MTELANPLLLLALVLCAGLGSGAIAKRLHMPAVTGQILAGVLLGPSAAGLLNHAVILRLDPLVHFAFGLMAIAVGSHLNLRRLRNATRRLSMLLLLEATVTPVLVYAAIVGLLGLSPVIAFLLATMAVSTAPATVLALVKETRSRGVFVKTLLAAVALDNIATIGLFELAHTAGHAARGPDGVQLGPLLLAPITMLVSSALLGGGIGAGLVFATRKVVRADRLTTASMLAILLTAGLAEPFGASTLLSCLFLGVTLANLTPDKEEIGHEAFSNFEIAIFAVFFLLAGAELDLSYLAPAGGAALVVFLARAAGKLIAASVAMKIAGATRPVRRWLGAALIPQAGLAVALLLLVTEDPAFADIRDMMLAIGLTVVLLNELIGPVLTRTALKRSGDFGKDRERLIDFIHEEGITTDLKAESMEEAIEQLTGLLARTYQLRGDSQELLASIQQRERQSSTCLGDGLAVPHGELVSGNQILGVMGISRDGLRFPTPDGRPVHCVVLLVTPASQRNRHLEVLAALARAIGGDRGLQQQLYHAKSPGHAYDLLHADESEDFNYFLED